MNNHLSSNSSKKSIRNIRIAVLSDEPLGWGSGKNYFPAILDGYSWDVKNNVYQFETNYISDKDILKGKLDTKTYDVLLVPGGGVGDGEAVIRGFNLSSKVRKWKKNIVNFIKDGGGYVGICGGAALITELSTGSNIKPISFVEKQYKKSSLEVSCIKSYYQRIALPIFFPFQMNYPEKIGAIAYVFSFAPGETVDGTRFFSAGVPIDFQIDKGNPIFSDLSKNTERIRWWGGPALIFPEKPDREVKILARYPKIELSEDETTRIFAWKYTGGVNGLLFSLFKAAKLIKENNESLRNLLIYAYYLAGNWKPTQKPIELNFSNKPSMTSEIYPNENQGRIILCTAHPEYMIWWNGKIEKVGRSDFNCIAKGFHQWKNVSKLSKNAIDEFTHTWWIVRRMAAWAAKVPDNHMPPITKGQITTLGKDILNNEIFWDGTILHQMKDI
jgi:glutamine amidotransferase-like uncharacterized protein